MTVSFSRVLCICATIVFAVAFGMLLFASHIDPKTIEEFTLGGLALFAASHCLP